MNRKQKIIVSVVGITIVLLALLGITYAYYLTRIQGNTNANSISITTANLKLIYGSDDGSIIGENEIIEPNKTFTTKTFTITNNGNETIPAYAIILDNVSITDATTGAAVALNSTRDGKDNDFDLTITCTNGTNECNGYSDVLPEQNSILLTNSIEPGETHTYSAVLVYQETNDDQSSDMNKRITGRFNIIDMEDTAIIAGKVTNTSDKKYYVQTNSTKRISYIDVNGNYKIFGLELGEHTIKLCELGTDCSTPTLTKNLTITSGTTPSANNTTGVITIKDDTKLTTININADASIIEINNNIGFSNPYKEGTLPYALLNTAANATGTSTVLSVPLTTPYIQKSAETERVLAKTYDDYGTSYYYRGNIEDNYVNFAGMCWRVVRITGDDGIKLILEDSNFECNNASFTGNSIIGDGNYGYYTLDDDEMTDDFRVSYLNPIIEPEKSMVKAFYNFQNDELFDYSENLKSGNWCLGDKAYKKSETDSSKFIELSEYDYSLNMYLDFEVRTNSSTPEITLKCNGTVLNKFSDVEDSVGTFITSESPMYVGALTADEAALAGIASYVSMDGYYENYSFLSQNTSTFTLLNTTGFKYSLNCEDVYVVDYSVFLNNYASYASFRPAIVLKNDVPLKTDLSYMPDGTIDKPYVIG